eukprot:1777501-Rhodomonas_salina.1
MSNKACLAKQAERSESKVQSPTLEPVPPPGDLSTEEPSIQLKEIPDGFTPSLNTTFECAFCGRVLVDMRGLKGHQMSNKA